MLVNSDNYSKWKNSVIQHLKFMLGSEFNNSDNLDFLLPNDASLKLDFNDNLSSLLTAQLIWADSNLQFSQGREFFLMPNENHNEQR